MSTDFENELRDLFRQKAAEAPLATPTLPASAPQRVLRRGRLHQAGTVLGLMVVVIALIVGSVAGLTRILDNGPDSMQTGDYEIFERTARIEAFTITSPSDWFLVNRWPVSRRSQYAASALCPEGDPTTIADCVTPANPVPVDPSLGLPMLQLTNEDIGLGTAACGEELRPQEVVLYIALDYESDAAGVYPPYLPGAGNRDLLSEGDGPCGPGRYASFSVSGEPFFAWVGLGRDVPEADRRTVMTAFESMTVDDTWEPAEPDHVTPAYVVAGGFEDDGDTWRLELRPSERNVELTLMGETPWGALPGFSVPESSIEWCCDGEPTDPIFGAVVKEATGVEYRAGTGNVDLGGSPVPGTILPVPPSMGSFDFDLFFIDPPKGYADQGGQVIALGLKSARPAPSDIAEPRARSVELSGSFEGRDWSARFTGAFTGPGSPCVEVTIEGPPGHFCPDPVHSTLAGPSPYLKGSLSSELYLLVGSVPPEIEQVRFDGDDDAIVPQEFRCEMGPRGWTDPDRKVCAVALPSSGSGTLRYLDANGDVVYEEGIGWGAAEPGLCCPVDPALGRTYWAVYAWVGSGREEAEIETAQRYLKDRGVHGLRGSLLCDEGAAEALGTSAEHKVAVYFETEEEANTFALGAGLLGHEAGPVVAKVTIACLE